MEFNEFTEAELIKIDMFKTVTKNSNFKQYYTYIKNHIEKVKEAFYKYKDELFKILKMSNLEMIYTTENIMHHDESKLEYIEFSGYINYWYPDKDNIESEESKYMKYMKAWNHHIHNNPHHPEYWIVFDDDKRIVLDMDAVYILEMLCDWESFRKEDGTGGAYDYYYKVDRKEGLLSDNTRKLVEACLEVMK